MFIIPVCNALLCCDTHFGTAKPQNKEKPQIRRLRGLFIWMNCKLDNPIPAIIEKVTKNTPPTMGCGSVTNTAENLVIKPIIIMRNAAYWITLRFPT